MIEIRRCPPDELPRVLHVLGTAFGEPIPTDEVPRFQDVLPAERIFGGYDGTSLVGTGATFPFTMTVPGGTVPAAGVTLVGVSPTHRRKGIMSGVMRALIDDAHQRREPVAILWASEESIYQRFGYGLASNQGRIDIERERTRFLGDPPAVGRFRLISLEEAVDVLPPIYDAVLPTRPGMLARSPEWWRGHTLSDPQRHREGASGKFCCVCSIDGVDRAYALYRTGGGWGEDGTAAGWVNVIEALAVDPVAYRAIWRFLFDIDLSQRTRAWFLPGDLPLTLMLEEPRRLRFAKSESLWLRLVDARAALEARSYLGEGSITFALSDEYCPWNNGEWTLHVQEGRGRIEPGGEPELSLDAAALATVYLGGFSFSELQRALRVDECAEGAITRADSLFRTQVAPWCVEVF